MQRVACTIVLAILISGLGGCAESDPAQDLEVYRHALDGAPTTLDPAHASTFYANFLVVNLYDTLYAYKYLARPYELKPNLAAAMPRVSEDGLTYIIPIKQGVHFIDDPAFPGGQGREVTARDVVYSLKRHFDPETRSQGQWLWRHRIVGLDAWGEAGADYDEPVAGLKPLDRYTLKITLTKPYPQLIYTLATGFSAVVPREAVAAYGPALAQHPVGSGPFMLKSFNAVQATLVPNPDYRWRPVDIQAEGYDPSRHDGYGLKAIDGRTPPFVDEIEVHFIAESPARWASFTKGDEIQFTVVPNEQLNNVLAGKDPVKLKPEYAQRYHMRAYLAAGFVYTGFNMAHPAIGYNKDPKREARNHALRCAIINAFNWEARNKRFYFGMGHVFPGVIPPILAEYNPQLSDASITRNPEKAKALLQEYGWTPENLPVISYGFHSTVDERQAFAQLRGFLSDIGYPRDKIVPRAYATFGDFSRALNQREVMMFLTGWTLDYPDAQNVLQLFYGPYATPGSNSTNYNNPTYDRLYERTMTMAPSPERTHLYHRMNRMLIEDCVAITGLTRTRVMLWHDNVIAFPDHQMVGGFFLKYVDLEENDSSRS